jgi:hypothetical protein
MKTIFSLTQILIILIFVGFSAQGQQSKDPNKITPWEIGLSAGVSSFITSVNPEAAPHRINYWNNDLNPGIGLSLTHNISPSLGVEGVWLNTRLTGQWNNRFPPLPVAAGHDNPLTFNSGINQFDLLMAFNVNQILLPGEKEDPWHIFVKTGIGLTLINDQKRFYSNDHPYQKYGLTLDAGFSCSLSRRMKLQAGSAWRFVDTDNLDGVHVTSSDGTAYYKVYEIYNYNYLRLTYCLGAKSTPPSHDMIK